MQGHIAEKKQAKRRRSGHRSSLGDAASSLHACSKSQQYRGADYNMLCGHMANPVCLQTHGCLSSSVSFTVTASALFVDAVCSSESRVWLAATKLALSCGHVI